MSDVLRPEQLQVDLLQQQVPQAAEPVVLQRPVPEPQS